MILSDVVMDFSNEELLQRLGEQQQELELLRGLVKDKDASIGALKAKLSSLKSKSGGCSPTSPDEEKLRLQLMHGERRTADLQHQLARTREELEQCRSGLQGAQKTSAVTAKQLQQLQKELLERDNEVQALRGLLAQQDQQLKASIAAESRSIEGSWQQQVAEVEELRRRVCERDEQVLHLEEELGQALQESARLRRLVQSFERPQNGMPLQAQRLASLAAVEVTGNTDEEPWSCNPIASVPEKATGLLGGARLRLYRSASPPSRFSQKAAEDLTMQQLGSGHCSSSGDAIRLFADRPQARALDPAAEGQCLLGSKRGSKPVLVQELEDPPAAAPPEIAGATEKVAEGRSPNHDRGDKSPPGTGSSTAQTTVSRQHRLDGSPSTGLGRRAKRPGISPPARGGARVPLSSSFVAQVLVHEAGRLCLGQACNSPPRGNNCRDVMPGSPSPKSASISVPSATAGVAMGPGELHAKYETLRDELKRRRGPCRHSAMAPGSEGLTVAPVSKLRNS